MKTIIIISHGGCFAMRPEQKGVVEKTVKTLLAKFYNKKFAVVVPDNRISACIKEIANMLEDYLDCSSRNSFKELDGCLNGPDNKNFEALLKQIDKHYAKESIILVANSVYANCFPKFIAREKFDQDFPDLQNEELAFTMIINGENKTFEELDV